MTKKRVLRSLGIVFLILVIAVIFFDKQKTLPKIDETKNVLTIENGDLLYSATSTPEPSPTSRPTPTIEIIPTISPVIEISPIMPEEEYAPVTITPTPKI